MPSWEKIADGLLEEYNDKKNNCCYWGYGFIGSAVIRQLIRENKYNIINIDKLTYASNKKSINTKSLKTINITKLIYVIFLT